MYVFIFQYIVQSSKTVRLYIKHWPLVLLYLTVCWTQGGQGASREAGRKLEELQTCLFSPGWCSSHRHVVLSHSWPADTAITWPQGIFQVEFIYAYRTKVTRGQAVHHDRHAQCYKWSQLLHNHIFTKHGVRARGHGLRAWPPPFWLICFFPTPL